MTKQRFIFNVENFLETEKEEAYRLYPSARCATNDDDFALGLKLALLDAGVISLSPKREREWIEDGQLPKYLRIHHQQFERLAEAVSDRFLDVLM